MKAIYLNKKAGAESLIFGDMPKPQPDDGEVLVKVHATAIAPAEFQWFPTFNTPSGKPGAFPMLLNPGDAFTNPLHGVQYQFG